MTKTISAATITPWQ